MDKLKDKINQIQKLDAASIIFSLFMKLATFLTFSILFLIVAYIIYKGLPHLNFSMFSLSYTTENISMFPAILTTIMIIVLSLLISVPIGVFTAIYLVEYADKNSTFVEIIRITTETLAGIPSIVFGLFGMLFFVIFLELGYSLLSGTLTISIMILPLIIRSTEESLLAVDDSVRHGSFALGAGKLRTIFKVVLPVAMPGISSGIILAIGRIVGETAALLFTLGTATNLPKNLNESGRTLALHMYVLSSEGKYMNEAFATALVLLVIVFIINQISTKLSEFVVGGRKDGKN